MKIVQMSDNWNKINTREELVKLLKKYEGILSNSMINYLNSLIDLEFSVIRNYIKNNDRLALSELEVYKRIAMYNIYNRALKLFKENESELIIISGNNDGVEELSVYASLGEKRSCKLFRFNYEEDRGLGLKIPSGYRTMKIGNISLFQIIESKERREAELMRVMCELEKLYDEKNPYYSESNICGGPSLQWFFKHERKIKENEAKFNLLDSKKELTDEEKKAIEITEKYHELLLEDYGLKTKDFKEESNSRFGEIQTGLHQTLVKRMPNITIKKNIQYI